MKKLLPGLLFLLLTNLSFAQNIPAWSADDIIKNCQSKDTVYIINFWATWCTPCVAELPEFNALKHRYAQQTVKVILVSLDFKEDYPGKLARFLERKKITPQVVWLSDTDPNVFIPKIEDSWQGSIPATVIVSTAKGFKKFLEGSITEKQIANIADKLLADE